MIKSLSRIFIITASIVMASLCFGEEPAVRIYDFSGGLNTKAGLFQVKPNQGVECLNIDLSSKYGGIRPRYGFVSITDSLPWDNPTYGIYGYTARSGAKRLFGIVNQMTDSSFVGLGELVVSDEYSYSLDTSGTAESKYPYIYTGETPYWATWKDDVYLSNGRQVPVVYHNGYARNLVVQAPGEPMIYPINDTATWGDCPNGEYRYLIRVSHKTGVIYKNSYLSHPIKAFNEKVLLTNFPYWTHDSTMDTSSSYYDTVFLRIYRGVANINNYTSATVMYQIFGDTIGNADTVLDTLCIIDSIPDDSLGSGSYSSHGTPHFQKLGRASDVSIDGFRIGAPTYIGRNVDTAQDKICLPKDTAGNIDTNTICIVYMCTYTDTITGYESDSGRNLFIFIQTDTGKIDTVFDSNFVIGIPPVPSGSDRLMRNLYKAYGYTFSRDSLGGNIVTGWDTSYVTKWKAGQRRGRWHATEQDTILTPIYSLDTTISNFYLLALIKDSSIKQFVDTNSWDSISTQRDIYYRSGAPTGLNYISIFGDRAWGADGSKLFYSYLDSGGYWAAFDDIALNMDDGDEITRIVPYRDHIKVFKNKAQFILYTDDGINYNRKWVVDGIGCIAPRSMTAYNNGLVYLSEHGVIYETGLIYKDRGSSFDIISMDISDLLDYTPDQHRTAVGIVKDNKYWLSYSAKDTTYVYDFIVKAWSIYDYSFTQATFYDTIHSSNIRPAKDMLFITENSDKIYKADTTTTDNGSAIPVVWKSGALGMSPTNKTIGNIGVYCDADMVDSTFSIQVYDAKETLADSVDYTVSYPYDIQGMPPSDLYNYYQIAVKNVSGGTDTLATFRINGIDIWTGTESAIPIK